jgi:hypothetical protein
MDNLSNTDTHSDRYLDAIERHVPIPSAQRDRASWSKVVNAMAVGDSIMFPNQREAQNFAAALRNYGYRSVIRTQKSSAVRVWKMDKRPC